MFERLVVRIQNPLDEKRPLDLGALVEGALFYGRTEIVMTPAVIAQITRTWGTDGVLQFLDSGAFVIRYQQNSAGIRTHNTGTGRERHAPVIFEVRGHEGASVGPELLLGRVLQQVIQREGKSRRLTKQICQRLNVERLDPRIESLVTTDLLDKRFVRAAALEVIRLRAPELKLPHDSIFEVQQVDDGLRVLTNIDFNAVNAVLGMHVSPAQAALTPAYVLSHVLAARELLEDAARSKADMLADSYNSKIAELRVQTGLGSYVRSLGQITQFQDFVLDDGRAIREAVNEGRVTLDQILLLLYNAKAFRSFIAERPPQADLVREYFREVTKATWVDRLPSKMFRWLLFSGVGLALDAAGAGGAGALGGLALGAADSLVLDSILKGWKPNQFVESNLVSFVRAARNK